MIRRPPRSTLDRSSAASDVYKRQMLTLGFDIGGTFIKAVALRDLEVVGRGETAVHHLSLIHISEPTRPY